MRGEGRRLGARESLAVRDRGLMRKDRLVDIGGAYDVRDPDQIEEIATAG